MSDFVFPSLVGLSWNVKRSPSFKTEVKRALSGREIRGTFQRYPLYEFKLSYEFLRAGSELELQKLVTFFLARQGAFDSFLFTDPLDNAVVDGQFNVGDGSSTSFQLIRAFTGGLESFVEPVQNVNVLTSIKIDGVETSDYVRDQYGVITFQNPPSGGQELTWTGSYYYRCRFMEDMTEFNNFMQDLWDTGEVQFVGAIGNKV